MKTVITRLMLLAAIFLAAGSMSLRAEIITGPCGDSGPLGEGYNVTFSLDTETGVLVISGEGGMYRSPVQGGIYESDTPFYPYKDYIRSVVIEEGVTSIGAYAFSNCINLTDVEIAFTVITIGQQSFRNSTGLTEVVIPEGVVTIGDAAFWGCTGLVNVTIPNSVMFIESGAFSDCINLETLEWDINEYIIIEDDAFSGCENLKEPIATKDMLIFFPYNYEFEDGYYAIPENIKYVGAYAFNNCINLKRVYIPETLIYKYVAGYSEKNTLSCAFDGCSALERIDVSPLSKGYSSVEGVLYNKRQTELLCCPALVTSVTVPETVEKMDRPFDECTVLRDLRLENLNNITKMAMERYENAGGGFGALFKLDSTEYIENYSYVWNKVPDSLEKLTLIGDSICIGYFDQNMNVGRQYNKYTASIDTVIIETSVFCENEDMGGGVLDFEYEYRFGNPEHLELIYHGKEQIKVSDVTCCDLRGNRAGNVVVLVMDSLENMPAEFLRNLPKLRELTLPFPGTGDVINTSNFGELFSSYDTEGMRRVTQVMMDGKQKTYGIPAGLEKLTITEGCGEIPYGCFYGCTMLQDVTLPTTVYSVGEKAFYGCAGLQDLRCKSADPAVAYDNTFDGMRLTSCTLHVPYNSGEMYSRSPGWERFYNIEEEAPITITVIKNIENGGTVYGLNEYQPGDMAELSAVANSGYRFAAWAEDGEVVTEEDTYTFTVTGSRVLTAVFVPVIGENDVTLTAGGNKVTLQWDAETGATGYKVEVFADEDMTMPVGMVETDASGKLMAPAAGRLSAAVYGLDFETRYWYSLTVLGDAGILLSRYTGEFVTGNVGISECGSGGVMCHAVPGGVNVSGVSGCLVAVYDMQGVRLYAGEQWDESLFIPLGGGLYVVAVDGERFKVAVP